MVGAGIGWAWRIWTSVWPKQNPLAYHLAAPQPPRQVIRIAPHQHRAAGGPCDLGAKIAAYHAREDWDRPGIVRSAQGTGTPGFRSPWRHDRNRFSRKMAIGCYFPAISRLARNAGHRQGRRGIARSARDAGGHRAVLLQTQGGADVCSDVGSKGLNPLGAPIPTTGPRRSRAPADRATSCRHRRCGAHRPRPSLV